MKENRLLTTLLMMAMLLSVLACSKNAVSSAIKEQPSAETMGIVNARETWQPIQGARVMTLPSRSMCITGEDGKCSFDRPVTDTLIVFRKRGYKLVKVPINAENYMIGAVFDKK